MGSMRQEHWFREQQLTKRREGAEVVSHNERREALSLTNFRLGKSWKRIF